MQFQGVFERGEVTKFGHVLHCSNQQGEWRLYSKGKDGPPHMQPGTPVVAMLEKKGKSWYYENLAVGGLPAQQAYSPPAPAYTPPPQYAPPPPPQYQQPQPVYAPPAPRPEPRHFTERCMFVTGTVTRSLGSGQFAASDIKLLALAANAAWDELEAVWAGQRPAAQPSAPHPPQGGYSDANPPPARGEGDYWPA